MQGLVLPNMVLRNTRRTTFALTDPAGRGSALAIEGAHAFDPPGGRPLKEWVVVPASRSHHRAALAQAAIA